MNWEKTWMRAGLLAFLIGNLSAHAQSRDFGADVSHFQGSSGVSQSSWNQMYSASKRFAFIKATEGLTGPDDATMATNVVRAASAGFLIGVYHYPHPENRPTPAGAVQEADHFLSYAGRAVGPGYLRPVLDVEGSSANLSKTALTDWIIAFCDRVVAQRGVEATPIIYMTRSFVNSEVDGRLAPYDLWLAAYYTNTLDYSVDSPLATTTYPNPLGVFTNWAFWQYTASGSSGGISPLDLDVCHNEYKSLRSFLIPYPPVVLSNFVVTAGSTVQFSFTNTAGELFPIVATTDLSIPRTNWTTLGNATETTPGNYSFSDTPPPGSAQRFYSVRSP